MDIKSLEYIIALEKYQSVTIVAKKYKVSEQTIKNYISRLEDEIGFSCFDKSVSKNKFIFSESGKKVKKVALKILNDYYQLKQDIKTDSNIKFNQQKGNYDFIIGVSAIPKYCFMEDISDTLLDDGMYISVKRTDPIEIVQDVLNGELNLGFFTYHNIINKEWEENAIIIPLLQEQSYIAVSKKHFLANYKKINIDDLKNCKLAIYQEGKTPASPSVNYLCQKNIPQIITNDSTLFEKTIIRNDAVGFITNSLLGGRFFINEEAMRFIPFNVPGPTINLIINQEFFNNNQESVKYFLGVLLEWLQGSEKYENGTIRDFFNRMQNEIF